MYMYVCDLKKINGVLASTHVFLYKKYLKCMSGINTEGGTMEFFPLNSLHSPQKCLTECVVNDVGTDIKVCANIGGGGM